MNRHTAASAAVLALLPLVASADQQDASLGNAQADDDYRISVEIPLDDLRVEDDSLLKLNELLDARTEFNAEDFLLAEVVLVARSETEAAGSAELLVLEWRSGEFDVPGGGEEDWYEVRIPAPQEDLGGAWLLDVTSDVSVGLLVVVLEPRSRVAAQRKVYRDAAVYRDGGSTITIRPYWLYNPTRHHVFHYHDGIWPYRYYPGSWTYHYYGSGYRTPRPHFGRYQRHRYEYRYRPHSRPHSRPGKRFDRRNQYTLRGYNRHSWRNSHNRRQWRERLDRRDRRDPDRRRRRGRNVDERPPVPVMERPPARRLEVLERTNPRLRTSRRQPEQSSVVSSRENNARTRFEELKRSHSRLRSFHRRQPTAPPDADATRPGRRDRSNAASTVSSLAEARRDLEVTPRPRQAPTASSRSANRPRASNARTRSLTRRSGEVAPRQAPVSRNPVSSPTRASNARTRSLTRRSREVAPRQVPVSRNPVSSPPRASNARTRSLTRRSGEVAPRQVPVSRNPVSSPPRASNARTRSVTRHREVAPRRGPVSRNPVSGSTRAPNSRTRSPARQSREVAPRQAPVARSRPSSQTSQSNTRSRSVARQPQRQAAPRTTSGRNTTASGKATRDAAPPAGERGRSNSRTHVFR